MKTKIMAVVVLALCGQLYAINEPLVSEVLLKEASLKADWQTKIALKNKEHIQRILLLDEQIYILSDQNYLFGLRQSDGGFLFSRDITRPRLPVYGPVYYENKLYLVAANELITLDAKMGIQMHRRLMPFAVCLKPAINSSFLYLVGVDKRLRAMDKMGESVIFAATADDDSSITALMSDDVSVLFGTMSGIVMNMHPSEPQRKWQFKAVGAVGGFARKNEKLFVSSRDTNIYGINFYNGVKLWTVHTGSALTHAPAAGNSVVYQYAVNKGMYAVDAASGEVLWLLEDGREVVAEEGGMAFVMNDGGKCYVMDNRSGKSKYCLNFSGVSHYAKNSSSVSMYIADKSGKLMRISPLQ